MNQPKIPIKYQLIISLAKSGFSPKEVTELTLASIAEPGIKCGSKVHILSGLDVEYLGIYLNQNAKKFEKTQYLFPARDLSKTDPDKLILWTERTLRGTGVKLSDIGWAKVAKTRTSVAAPRTLEEIIAFVARLKN